MEEHQNKTALTLTEKNISLRNKTSEVTAIRRSRIGSSAYVPHVSVGEVKLISTVAAGIGRHGDRNSLLIKFIFDSCLRVSEALSIRPVDITKTDEGWLIRVIGKGRKFGVIAISSSIAAEIQSYCYREKVKETARIFPITRSQAFRIVTEAFDKSGVIRPTVDRDHVGGVHILRHSGAIERLRVTGNPKAVQDQLRHIDAAMTIRYMKTLSAEESLKIQQGVELW